MSSLFTKEYSTRHFKFKVEVHSDISFSLIRLPQLNLPDEDNQMCSVYLKEIITKEMVGWVDDGEDMTQEEIISRFDENSGHESNRYTVGEYTGRESSSDNLYPDTALDGFLESELQIALDTLDKDEELYKQLMALHLEDMLLKPTA